MAKRQKQIPKPKPKPKPPWYQRPLAIGGIALSVFSGAAALVANYKAISSALLPEIIDIIIYPKTINYNNAKDDKTGFVTTEITSLFNIVKGPNNRLEDAILRCQQAHFCCHLTPKCPSVEIFHFRQVGLAKKWPFIFHTLLFYACGAHDAHRCT